MITGCKPVFSCRHLVWNNRRYFSSHKHTTARRQRTIPTRQILGLHIISNSSMQQHGISMVRAGGMPCFEETMHACTDCSGVLQRVLCCRSFYYTHLTSASPVQRHISSSGQATMPPRHTRLTRLTSSHRGSSLAPPAPQKEPF
jgi:hypothetical protein